MKDLHPDAEILFVGGERGLEKDIVPRAGFALVTLPALPLSRRLGLGTAKAGIAAFRGMWRASGILRRFAPDVVVGTGGYVSGAVALAAVLMRYPLLIQEQNALPGFTNRFLGRFADRVAVAYDEAVRYFPSAKRVKVVGNPVRREFSSTTREEGRRHLKIGTDKTVLLVVGASQGARSINRAVLGALGEFLKHKNLYVLHQTGAKGFSEVAPNLKEAFPGAALDADEVRLGEGPDRCRYRAVPYIHDMPDALAASDIVISRAGALSIAEITAVGRPAILIPFPYSAENHQEHNAHALERRGAGWVILDRDVTPELLVKTVRKLLEDPGLRRTMAESSRSLAHPRAVRDLVEMVAELAVPSR